MPSMGSFRVDWYGKPVGCLTIRAPGEYEWTILDPALNALFPQSRFAKGMPATVFNLHPDLGMFGELLNITTKAEYIERGMRALSNISFHPTGEHETIKPQFNGTTPILDVHGAALANEKDPALDSFHGTYAGPVGMAGTEEFNAMLKRQWIGRFSHRFSGKQTKLPMNLQGSILVPALGRLSFTHFAKYPTVGGRESDGLLEWMGLRQARDLGMEVNDFALVDQGRDYAPLLAVERFDIPKKSGDTDEPWVLLQDFYSILGQDPANDATTDHRLFRYDDLVAGFIDYSRKNLPDTPDKEERIYKNAQAVLKRIFLAWASNDGDLHAKNFSTLIYVDPKTKKITDVRFAPVYDSCPSVFSGKDGGSMYYNLRIPKGRGAIYEGKPANTLNMNSFIDFLDNPRISVGGKRYCIFDTRAEAETFIRDIAAKVAQSAVDSLHSIPPFVHDLKHAPMLIFDAQMAAAIAVERARKIGAKTPDYPFDPDIYKKNKEFGARARHSALGGEEGNRRGLYSQLSEKILAQLRPVIPGLRNNPA